MEHAAQAFPNRGTLDEYIKGQDDEGEAPEGKAWSDRESLLSPISSDPGDELRDGCAGGDALVLSEAQSVQVSEATQRLRQVEAIIAQAEEIGNPHIVLRLE